jgi:hypothetical protein
MFEYMMWLDARVGMAGTIAITTSIMALLATFLGLWIAEGFNTKCRKCGGGLRQLGYMDSRSIWCPRCNP